MSIDRTLITKVLWILNNLQEFKRVRRPKSVRSTPLKEFYQHGLGAAQKHFLGHRFAGASLCWGIALCLWVTLNGLPAPPPEIKPSLLPMTTLTPPGLSVPEKTACPGFFCGIQRKSWSELSNPHSIVSCLGEGAKASLGHRWIWPAGRKRSCFGHRLSGVAGSEVLHIKVDLSGITHLCGAGLLHRSQWLWLRGALPQSTLLSQRDCVLEERRANC